MRCTLFLLCTFYSLFAFGYTHPSHVCDVVIRGFYPNSTIAANNCHSAFAGDNGAGACTHTESAVEGFRYWGYGSYNYIHTPEETSYGTYVGICYGGSWVRLNPEGYIYLFPISGGCPEGSSSDPEILGGACTCDSGVLNYETLTCEPPQCQPPTTYNEATGLCEKECPIDKPWSDTARDCTPPPEPDNCSNQTGGPSNLAGNPINFFSGHKIQREVIFEGRGDFPLTFSWLYNSFGNHQKSGAGYSVGAGVVGETMLHTEPPLPAGELPISLPLDKDPAQEYTGGSTERWRHNHSYFLAHYTLPDGATERMIAYRPSGSDLHFVNESGVFVALANRDWRATKDLDENQEHVGWTLKVDGRIEKYDTAGRVMRVENEQGQGITYTYDGNGVQQETIADDNGNSITLAYTDGKLTQLTRNDSAAYQFAYSGNGLLQSITFPGSESPQRVFRYEDARFPYALTGVTDEAGKVFSSFVYDEQGRAIRSEHNGGAESVDVEYVDAGTRRLTNALGKQTTYHYVDVNGVKHITSIDGEASISCAAANMSYTYGTNGFVASETDWEGNVTTYTRDDLGRELTRIEAVGTASERMITTEWHPILNLPIKVASPESVTDYIYDPSGHLLSKSEKTRTN